MEAPANTMVAVLEASFRVQFKISVLLVVDKLRPSLQLLSLALCVLLLKQILALCVEHVNTVGLLKPSLYMSVFRSHHTRQISRE